MNAAKTENKMLADDLESRRAVAAGAGGGGGDQAEHVREVGRMQGQVTALQQSAKDALAKELVQKDQVLKAEEEQKKLQAQYDEVMAKCGEHVQTIKSMQAQMREKEKAADTAAAGAPKPAPVQEPKKCCVMS